MFIQVSAQQHLIPPDLASDLELRRKLRLWPYLQLFGLPRLPRSFSASPPIIMISMKDFLHHV
jgi:hypothetical protein